jgi:hypothetical protein
VYVNSALTYSINYLKFGELNPQTVRIFNPHYVSSKPVAVLSTWYDGLSDTIQLNGTLTVELAIIYPGCSRKTKC